MWRQDATLSGAGHRQRADLIVADTVDVGSANCATLILHVRSAMKELESGQVLEVIAYDPTSQLDLEAWCRMTGNDYLTLADRKDYQAHYLRKGNH